MGARFGEHQLDVADPPFREAGLAVLEVQRPPAPEALVVPERGQLVGVLGEIPLPSPERLDVSAST